MRRGGLVTVRRIALVRSACETDTDLGRPPHPGITRLFKIETLTVPNDDGCRLNPHCVGDRTDGHHGDPTRGEEEVQKMELRLSEKIVSGR